MNQNNKEIKYYFGGKIHSKIPRVNGKMCSTLPPFI